MKIHTIQIGDFNDQVTVCPLKSISLSTNIAEDEFQCTNIDFVTRINACHSTKTSLWGACYSTKISLWGTSPESLEKIGKAFFDLAQKIKTNKSDHDQR